MDQLAANTQFASSVVRFGLCDQEQADRIAHQVSRRWMPLGKILIRTKKLTIKQSGAVFSEQADQPRKLFGELAVELGFCTQEDVDEAIVYQRTECPHVLDLVMSESDVDPEKLLTAAADYIRYTERVIAQLETITNRAATIR